MKRHIIIFLVIVLVFILPLNIRGTQFGLTTAVAIAGSTVVPTGPGSSMVGFSAFAAGFVFTDSSTTCSFNAYFPVSGTVTLNNGALYLQQDLWFEQPITFNSVGTIVGNGNSLHLPSLLTPFSLPTLPITLPFVVSTNIDSNAVISVDWSYDNAYLAIGTNVLSANQLFVFSFNGTSLTSVVGIEIGLGTGGVASTVSWHPSSYYLAVAHSGSNPTWTYDFSPTSSTLTLVTEVLGTLVAGYGVSWTPNGSYLAYSQSTTAAGINVAPVTAGTIGTAIAYNLPITNGGMQGNCLSWNASGQYLAAGLASGTSTTQLAILNFNSTSTLITTTLVDIAPTFTVSALDWSKTNSLIAIGLIGGTNTVQLYSFSSSTSTVTQLTPALLGETRNISSIQWNPAGTLLAVAYATAPLGVNVYSFNTTTSVLTLQHAVSVSDADEVNTLRWSHNGTYLAFGDAGDIISIYENIGTSNLIFNNVTIVLQGDLVLTATHEFQGSCAIEGNGFAINCTSGAIQIDSGASLLIRNATVIGINAQNIIGSASTSALSLQNSTWVQSGNYTFSEGALNIIDNVTMNGQYSFIYTSSQATTINSDSSWLFDSGMTFSYAPTSGANNLLVMTDSTSLFHLYETSLYAPSTGLKFTKGTIIIEGICPIISSATSQANGIIFGDGISSANNAVLNVWPGSNFQINSGFVLYQNM